MNLNHLDAIDVEISRLQEAMSKVRLDHASNGAFNLIQPITHRLFFDPKKAPASKFTGSVKRASMDLSRALTELRKPE